jgi:hypothetical protein
MKGASISIVITSSVLVLYSGLSVIEGASFALIASLFLLLHVLLIWTVIRILKDPNESSKSFDEYFYEDKEFKRGNKSESSLL